MRTLWLIFFGLCSIGFVNGFESTGVNEWKKFKTQFGKVYESSSEEEKRMEIWMENKAEIERHNIEFEQGKVSYRQAVNKFADLTPMELEKLYMGFKVSQTSGDYEKRVSIKPTASLPDTVDWRDKGAVSSVKDQGQCGSCYAFSAVGAIEGQYALKTGNLQSFSEKQVVDCSKKFNNFGCDGGFMRSVYKYVQSNGGLDTEEVYPYEASQSECHQRFHSGNSERLRYFRRIRGSSQERCCHNRTNLRRNRRDTKIHVLRSRGLLRTLLQSHNEPRSSGRGLRKR
jgi:cathepsin L